MRDQERRRKARYSGRRLSTRRGTQDHRGGAPSPTPLNPNLSQVTPAAQVGGKTLIRDAGQETRRGNCSAVSRRFGDFHRTDDGWPDAAGGGRPTEQTRKERRQRKKDRGYRQTALDKEPGWILEGGRRGGDQNHHLKGEMSKINLEGQSLDIS